MNSTLDRLIRQPLIRRSALLIVLLSLSAALLLGLAEQGGVGSALSPVPDQPLPFPRESVYGLYLADRPSLEAVQWLQAADSSTFGLVVLPVDADIVSALLDSNQAPSAFRALDQMMAVTQATTIALCLERPVTQVEDGVLAELTVDTLRDRYPDRIAYLTACQTSDGLSWAQAISQQVRSTTAARPGVLLPLSTGAPLRIQDVESFNDLRTEVLRTFAGDRYILPNVPVGAPVGDSEVSLSIEAIRNAAQIALILLRPDRELDPAALVDSIAAVQLDSAQLPEGFSGVQSPAIQFGEGWEPSEIGRVSYRRTNVEGSVIQTTFVGTTIYLYALLAPDGGSLAVWVDPDTSAPGTPDAEIDLSAVQASDAAVILAEGLSADRHTIAILTTGGEVMVSGLFVSGQPETGWNAGLTILSLIAVGALAMAVLGLARVQDIRDRHALPPRQSAQLIHPRSYRIDE